MPVDYHLKLMKEALALARQAVNENEVPVGAVVAMDGEIIGRGFNKPIQTSDPTAHAEIQALREAAKHCGNYRLPEATLVVTLEPCAMCAGAIIQSRLERLVFGAYDTKSGACGSIIDLFHGHGLNHHTAVVTGVMQEQCAGILKDFFRARR